MRDFTRITLRVLMILFLLVGCGNNIYYLGKIAKKHDTYRPYNYYRSPYYSEPIDTDEYIEEVEEDTTQVTTYEEEEFPDYNRPITRY